MNIEGEDVEEGIMRNTENDEYISLVFQDVDCFYAQTEILQNPYLRQKPVGVTQKFLVVTCNYVAREAGVQKLVTIEEAQKRCPDIILVNGEDLTPYREASKKIMNVIGRFGILERSGLDECYLDITSEVMKRAASGVFPRCFSGFVIDAHPECDLLGERMREEKCNSAFSNLQDPCTSQISGSKLEHTNPLEYNSCLQIGKTRELCCDPRHLLSIGSHYVAEIRASVEKETGFQCSSGISYNKMLSKLACSVNKPNKQTCLLKHALSGFLRSLPIRKIPAVGQQTENLLKQTGIHMIVDLQCCSLQRLVELLGAKMGSFLFEACRGVDERPVQDKGPLKSLSVEDSFAPCTSLKNLGPVLLSLATDLIVRLDSDFLETGRRPRLFTLKWRQKSNCNFSSASCQMPFESLSTKCHVERRKNILVQTAMNLLSRSLGDTSFSIVVINIGATNFKVSGARDVIASQDIRSLLQNHNKCHAQEDAVTKQKLAYSKRGTGRKQSVADDQYLFQFNQKTNGNIINESDSGDELGNASIKQNECIYVTDSVCANQAKWANRGHISESSNSDDHLFVKHTFPQEVTKHEESGLELSLTCTAQKNPMPESDIHKINSGQFGRGNILGNCHENEVKMIDNVQCTKEETRSADSDQATVRSDTASKKNGMYFCRECGKEIKCGEEYQQEHEDYHYALELQSREASSTASLNIYRNTATNESPKADTTKKRKKHHLTLESFFSRLPR